MKLIITFGFVITSSLLFAQRLPGNRMPDNKSVGIKMNYNYNLPFANAKDFTESEFNINPAGYGGGVYFRYDFNEKMSFQPELLMSYRSSSLSVTNITNPAEEIQRTTSTTSNQSLVCLEVPLYFKMRWKLTSINKGHYKWSKAIGFYVGPRILANVFSRREFVTNESTRLYEQTSSTSNLGPKASGKDFYRPVTVGMALGADIEFTNRLCFYVGYYGGFMSLTRKEVGYNLLDHRVEVGLGLRIY